MEMRSGKKGGPSQIAISKWQIQQKNSPKKAQMKKMRGKKGHMRAVTYPKYTIFMSFVHE